MKFELYSARWHSQVVALADDVLGKGYFSGLAEIANAENVALLVGYEGDDELACFALGTILPENGLKDHLEGQLPDLPADIADADREGTLGVIQAVVVAGEHRRKGYGSDLIGMLHDRLVGMGADKLIVTFKRGRNVPHVDGMMEKLGFSPWQRLPSFWQVRCDAGEFHCADRQGQCSCEALLYRKTVF